MQNQKPMNQSVEDFLANGGKVEKLPPAIYNASQKQTSIASRTEAAELLSLADAEALFGHDRSRNKTETKEEIVELLSKVVQRNPNFLEQHKIPNEYVQLLPEELRSAAKLKTKKMRQKIDKSFIDPELAALIALTQPQVLEDIGMNGGDDEFEDSSEFTDDDGGDA